MAVKFTGESQLITGKSPVTVSLNDISPVPAESGIRFRVIYYWEPRNIAKAEAFIGLELLLIYEQETVMQEFNRFRFHSHEDFQYKCGPSSVNIQSLIDPHILDEAEIMSVVFWYIRNQKMYMLSSNLEIAKRVNADDVTKAETMSWANLCLHQEDICQEKCCHAPNPEKDCRDGLWFEETNQPIVVIKGKRSIVKIQSSITTKSAPLAGLLAHSAGSAGSQLISARRTVRVSGRWSGSGPVAGWVVQPCGPWTGGLLGKAVGCV
ncbi:Uncharacterized protein Rs2_16202 [Raphanus sativus]|nr:Uncharacterized protein Rs2_16202 [Raphanus sativus]